jgi:8-oxo-dGTP pyrophosphatase MutT (NUDIX family)
MVLFIHQLNTYMDIFTAYKIIKESKVNQFSGAGIVFYDGERILLLKKANRKWGFVGGKPIEEETPLKTAMREAKEEIGTIHGVNKKELKISLRGNTYYTYIFKVEKAFEDITLSDEHIDYSWVKLDNLDKIKLSKAFQACMGDILKALRSLR